MRILCGTILAAALSFGVAMAAEPAANGALRLVVTEAWGGGRAHVFAFDAR